MTVYALRCLLLDQAFSSPALDALAHYPVAAQVLLCALVRAIRAGSGDAAAVPKKSLGSKSALAGGKSSVAVSELRTLGAAFFKRLSMKAPASMEFTELLDRLRSDGVVSVGSGRDAAKCRVSIAIEVAGIEAALSDKPFWNM